MNLFKKKPSQSTPTLEGKTIIQEYFSTKESLTQMPVKIKMFFDMSECYADKSSATNKEAVNAKQPKQILETYKPFCKSFEKMPLEEKYSFLLDMIKLTKELIENTTISNWEGGHQHPLRKGLSPSENLEKEEKELQESTHNTVIAEEGFSSPNKDDQSKIESVSNPESSTINSSRSCQRSPLRINSINSHIQKIETTCSVRGTFLGMNTWESKIFCLESHNKVLKLYSKATKQKETLFHLNNYNIRQSTGEKNTLVLEIIFEEWKIPEKYRHFYIYFNNKILFQEIYQQMKMIVLNIWKERLISMLNEAEIENIIENGIINLNSDSNVPVSSAPKMLNSSTITEYFKMKDKIEQKILSKGIGIGGGAKNGNSKTMKFSLFSEIHKISIYRCRKYQNLYKVEHIVPLPYDEVLKSIELINRDTSSNSSSEIPLPPKKLLHFEKMETFSANLSASYYKYIVKGTTHDMISIVEDVFKENECIITFKSFGNLIKDKNIDFLQIHVKKVDDKDNNSEIKNNSIVSTTSRKSPKTEHKKEQFNSNSNNNFDQQKYSFLNTSTSEEKTKIFVYGFINFSRSGTSASSAQKTNKLKDISVIDFLLSIVECNQSTKLQSLKLQNNEEMVFNRTGSFEYSSSSKKYPLENEVYEKINFTATDVNSSKKKENYQSSEDEESSIDDEGEYQEDIEKKCSIEEEDEDDEFHTVVGDNFESDEERELELCNTFEDLPSVKNRKGEVPEKNRKKSDQKLDEVKNSKSKEAKEHLSDEEDDLTECERNVVNEFKTERGAITERSISPEMLELKNERKSSMEQNRLTPNAYLLVKYPTKPLEPLPENKKLIKRHYFINEWGKYDKGGMFSLNSVLLEKQKQVFKSILTRMGNSLFKKTSVSFSLPVIVFKPESQLETIAVNWSMAPRLLENLSTATPLDRMHKTIIFMISMGTIGLSLQKPFNPIVGETFQAMIDNCPIYMEQIEHHPSISAGLFIGRGYKVYGNVNPQISIGLNSIKGYSEDPLRVSFEVQNKPSEGKASTEEKHEEIIEFRPGRMLMSGFLVGDRTFDFADSIFHIDHYNLLFGEIIFGSKKRYLKQYPKADKTDFLHGFVYKVTEEFYKKHLKEYNHNKTRLSPSSDKESKVLSEIYGCWNEKIFIQNEEVINFETYLPCKVVRQKESEILKSDSILREDMKLLEIDEIEKAQDGKDLLEEIQRKDSKLRKEYEKKGNTTQGNQKAKPKK